MTQWFEIYDSVFFIAIAGGIIGVVGLCIKACVKCKWVEFDGCCIHIKRNPELEIDDDDPPSVSSKTSLQRKQSNLSNRNII